MTLDDNANSHLEVANIILSTISELDTAIEELSAAMKTLVVILLKQRTLAAQEQNRAMEDPRAAREKIIASMAEAAQNPCPQCRERLCVRDPFRRYSHSRYPDAE